MKALAKIGIQISSETKPVGCGIPIVNLSMPRPVNIKQILSQLVNHYFFSTLESLNILVLHKFKSPVENIFK